MNKNEQINGGQNIQVDSIKFRTIRGKYVPVTKKKALKIARRLYQLSKGEYRTELINRRFIGIEFTWEQLYKS